MKVAAFVGSLGLAVLLFAQSGFAQSQTVSGYLVDVMCSTAHAKEGAS